MARASMRSGANRVFPSSCRRPLRHPLTFRASPSPRWPAGRGAGVRSSWLGPVAVTRSDQRPDDPGHTVGQGDRDDLHRLSPKHAAEPVRAGRLAAPRADPRHRAEMEKPTQIAIARLRDAAEPLLPARGMRLGRRGPERDPSERRTARPARPRSPARSGRPRHRASWPRALAVIAPIPGTVARRRARGSSLCAASIRAVTVAIRSCVSRSWSASTPSAGRAASGAPRSWRADGRCCEYPSRRAERAPLARRCRTRPDAPGSH